MSGWAWRMWPIQLRPGGDDEAHRLRLAAEHLVERHAPLPQRQVERRRP